LSACATEPETIVETVIHEATVEVLQTVEVTRQVEVPVEVTRLIDVTKEVQVEVTRIVEVVITATPEPTPEPTQEPTPTNTLVSVEAAQPAATPVADALPSPASDVASSLLQASRSLREHIYSFRDNGLGSGDCYVIVENQDNFLAAPSFDVSGASSEVQSAYGHYLSALDLAKDAALGIGQGCRDAITNQKGFSITGLNYNDMRGKLDRALEELAPAIEVLESLPVE
jgi:hypothetical protein